VKRRIDDTIDEKGEEEEEAAQNMFGPRKSVYDEAGDDKNSSGNNSSEDDDLDDCDADECSFGNSDLADSDYEDSDSEGSISEDSDIGKKKEEWQRGTDYVSIGGCSVQV
jgi:hypothetical protein